MSKRVPAWPLHSIEFERKVQQHLDRHDTLEYSQNCDAKGRSGQAGLKGLAMREHNTQRILFFVFLILVMVLKYCA